MLKTLTSPPQTSENHQTQLSCQGREFQPTRDLHLITWTSKKREGRILHADVFFPSVSPQDLQIANGEASRQSRARLCLVLNQ